MGELHTEFLVPDLHCPSCVLYIESLLATLCPKPLSIKCSLASHTVAVSHLPKLGSTIISAALAHAGYPAVQNGSQSHQQSGPLSCIFRRLRDQFHGLELRKRRKTHLKHCESCQKEALDENSVSTPQKEKNVERTDETDEKTLFTPLETIHADPPSSQQFQALFSITGMTCSACVRSITEALQAKPCVRSANVVLLANSAIVDFEGEGHTEELAQTIEELGYEAVVEEVKPLSQQQHGKEKLEIQVWRASYCVEGIRDNSDAGVISKALEREPWTRLVNVNLLTANAIVEFEGKNHVSEIPIIISALGDDYWATLADLIELGTADIESTQRKVLVRVDGMSEEQILTRIFAAITALDHSVVVDKQPKMQDPILTVTYTPHLPDFTIRHILAAIESVDEALKAGIYHPPTLEERVRAMHTRERQHVIYRVALSAIAAIPSFVIGIVLMSLVPPTNSARIYLMKPWANVSRGQWALLIIATPIYFFAADMFHRRALLELFALWRPGSSTPIFRRFYRFGSMNLLMSLGTSIAYFCSIAQLIIASRKPSRAATVNQSFYFDSVVFLTMFLLIGRLIEAWSRAKTADAVTSLGQLRPSEAVLCDSTRLDKTNPDLTQKVPVDLIEVGDIILVSHGASPPCDGILLDGEGGFDESSLTGESRLIKKGIGDDVLSGTINQGSPIIMRVTKAVGSSMLDQIINVVREGQVRRAPVERVGDTITSYFVPVITLISVLTWIIWLVLGQRGTLPKNWLDVDSGGWPYWSLQFSIAVFIIACPCGIGLAAPTALFVGGGIAAKNGILAKGGGEAFQEASTLDLVVFDKTGTLTDGGKPAVTDYEYMQTAHETQIDETLLQSLIRAVEEKSSHPIALAIVTFFSNKSRVDVRSTYVNELPGRGIKGYYTSDEYPDKSYMILVGNERLMEENDVSIDASVVETLKSWKLKGKSVVLVAIRIAHHAASPDSNWTVHFIAGVSDPIRPESASVVEVLRKQGIDVWMISGDNVTTARAVGKMVGIPSSKIIAGVLPEQKAEKIQYLQRSQTKLRKGYLFRRRSQELSVRAKVAMVGDGVNDSPALTVSDVGIAIGSGSDVAISSADFVLVSSDLSAVLVLLQLSRVVFRRIKFNFGWALVYNLIALPIAAGVLYPLKSHGTHVRLDPVWASLAMALSSISVVTSSLALKTKLPYIGFQRQ